VLPCSIAALCSRNLRRAECMRSSVVSPTPMKPRTGRVAWSAWPFSKINAEYPPLEPRFLAVSKMSRNKQIHKKKNQSFTTVSLKETNKTPCFLPASFGDFVFKKRPNKAPCFCFRISRQVKLSICTRLYLHTSVSRYIWRKCACSLELLSGFFSLNYVFLKFQLHKYINQGK